MVQIRGAKETPSSVSSDDEKTIPTNGSPKSSEQAKGGALAFFIEKNKERARAWVHLRTVEHQGEHDLRKAVIKKDREKVRHLIDNKGINVNALSRNDVTALHYAVGNKDEKMVGLLVRRHADPELTRTGSEVVSPLANARSLGYSNIVSILEHPEKYRKQYKEKSLPKRQPTKKDDRRDLLTKENLRKIS